MYKQDALIDRREMLRVNVKSLAEEARMVRREEARTHEQLRDELHLHRVGGGPPSFTRCRPRLRLHPWAHLGPDGTHSTVATRLGRHQKDVGEVRPEGVCFLDRVAEEPREGSGIRHPRRRVFPPWQTEDREVCLAFKTKCRGFDSYRGRHHDSVGRESLTNEPNLIHLKLSMKEGAVSQRVVDPCDSSHKGRPRQ